MSKLSDVDTCVALEAVRAIGHKRADVETLIMRTPSGELRNLLTEANIHMMAAQHALKTAAGME